MSEKNDSKDDTTRSTDGETAAGDTAEDAAFDEEDIVAAPARSARLVPIAALGAFVLSIVALAGVGLQWLQEQPIEPQSNADIDRAVAELAATNAELADRLDAVDDAIRPLSESIDRIEQRIASLAADDDVAEADIDALERRFSQQLTAIESVPARIASIERAISTLRGISTGARDAWLLAQAEYFLQIANAELELGRNPDVALKALEMADERLLSLDDAGLADLRRELSADIQALEALDPVDVAGIAATLAGLARVVDSLPIRAELLTRLPEADGGAVSDGTSELSGSERALATLRNAFSGVISVRRTDEKTEPLIAPESVYFLRLNLALQLQAARLALLRGEEALLDQSLDDASAWLREYYDTGSTPVRSALTTIGEIRDAVTVQALPDVSDALRLIRQYIAFRDAGNREAAAETRIPRAGVETAAEPAAGEPVNAGAVSEPAEPADDGPRR
ncbi:MAG: uroporphyrinogen-III C-methyltransferase [Woeseiaceae bacterium]|nr:uroporphyrinogen-III C-methyltransferase [Woeseiaceae bacterium]